MAEEKKTIYPMLSAKSWWALREKLNTTPRVKVTPSFLASLLGMEEQSVKINALNYFKQLGLLDEEGNPTDLAMRWRDDGTYPEVCKEIRSRCYPQELIDLFPAPDANVLSVKRWFMNSARVGEASATKQASLYLLLTKADSGGATETPKKNVNAPAPKAHAKPKVRPAAAKPPEDSARKPLSQQSEAQPAFFPALHIDIQIHIAPDTPPEQIDRIFESMAKHLQNMKGNKAE